MEDAQKFLKFEIPTASSQIKPALNRMKESIDSYLKDGYIVETINSIEVRNAGLLVYTIVLMTPINKISESSNTDFIN